MIDLSKCYVYDIEADGLLDTITKIHCLSVGWRDSNGNFRISSTTDYDVMRKFFNRKDIKRIGHNITLYDERAVARILGVDTLGSKDQIIDTLALSWYLYPERLKHGLEDWGKDLGVKKVEIKDWKNLSSEEYVHRCEEDVKINFKLWEKCLDMLSDIYDTENEIVRFINYLQFKLDCVREQEDTKIKLNVLQVMKDLDDLKNEKLNKEDVLRKAMPKVPIKVKKKYKNVVVDEKTGDFAIKGDFLYDHYISLGYTPKAEYEVDIIKGYKEPNPNSNTQKKDWLYSLGWQPRTFEYKKEKDGSQRKVPQIGSSKKDGTLCESVQELFEKEPRLEVLEGLSIISHRIGTLEGFLENQVDGYMEPSMLGLTNTLRLKHAKIVNLPGVDKKYGKQIRGALIASEGEILCGSDMSSLEDTTKQHYMYFYDPVYVTEMRTPGFDPHLDIAVLSGLLTQVQADDHKAGRANYKTIRHTAKTVNFASVYGAGPPKIALTANISLREAKKLHETYWKRNKAVKQVSDHTVVKTVQGKKWLFNPVSKFWYSLRAEKDRFSTLNQGTGVYCFDMFIQEVRKRGIKISLQMHDEILFRLEDSKYFKEQTEGILKQAIKSVNDQVKLNVPLGISMDFGYNYADCH